MRAWMACVSNIEQPPQVYSARVWGAGERGSCFCSTRKPENGAVIPSLLSIFYQAKHHQISEQPLDSKIIGNLDKASEHFIVKWVVHQYESLPVEVENDIAHDLDEIVSSRRERFVEMRLKYPKAPPDGFLVFDGDGIEVRR